MPNVAVEIAGTDEGISETTASSASSSGPGVLSDSTDASQGEDNATAVSAFNISGMGGDVLYTVKRGERLLDAYNSLRTTDGATCREPSFVRGIETVDDIETYEADQDLSVIFRTYSLPKCYAIEFARKTGVVNPDFIDDRDVVLAAVSKTGRAIKDVSDALREDRRVVLAAVKQDGMALESAAESLRGDRDVVLAAVSKYGYSLKYASVVLRADRNIVLAAVKNKGMALGYASGRLNGDREIALAACVQDSRAIGYVSDELRADPDFVHQYYEITGNQGMSTEA